MMKCKGCGVILQDNDSKSAGYTNNINNDYCLRCFRIKNYNEYNFADKTNEEYIEIIKEINKTDSLVLLVVDLFNIGNLEFFSKYLTNDVLLVLTKRDLLPLSVYEENILNYFNDLKLNVIDKVIISSKNNYNYDELYSKINKYKTDNIYVVGYTNSGKSSMINKLIYNYTSNKPEIITSNLPSTTLSTIEIEFDEFKLIDTPGILDDGNIINYISEDKFKKIIPKREIKPKSYQVKDNNYLYVEDICRVDVSNNNIIFYISNDLEITREYKDSDKLTSLEKHEININEKTDIVINGLGFITVLKPGLINLYTLKGVKIYTRKSLI